MLLRLDGEGPLYVRIGRALRTEILGGRLAQGARLPSTRALATDLGVSRNIVLLAYERLLAEGYATARRGSGTHVAFDFAGGQAQTARPAERSSSRTPRIHLSGYARRVAAKPDRSGISWAPMDPRLPYDFRYGRPSFGDFPFTTWCRLLARRARRATIRELDYGRPEGLRILRERVADYLRRARGVNCVPEQVLIVDGTQQALDLAARVLVDPGDRVLLEEPHYRPARVVFAAAGARTDVIEVDAQGMRTDRLPVRQGRHRVVFVTPSHQFPTGAVMPLSRRIALLAWAQRAGAWILEDDYDSEYRYGGAPLPALQGLDRAERVIYTGTFSKVMFPALRLGYMVLPGALWGAFLSAKAFADTGSPTLYQHALADFMGEGHFEGHLRRSRARNAARRAALLGAIERHLGDRVEVSGENAGLHVLLWLRGIPAGRVDAIRRKAAVLGVGVYPVAPFYLRPPGRAGLILGYAPLTEEEIGAGVERLARALA